MINEGVKHVGLPDSCNSRDRIPYVDFFNDAEMNAESLLFELGEEIVERNGQFKGIYKILYLLFEWIAGKLIYRNE